MNDGDEVRRFDAAKTYGDGAVAYEDAQRTYWMFLTDHVVESLALRAGEHLLDVACGTGPATIAAAHRVGPSGRAVGVDLAEPMLELASEKAAAAGLRNVEFRVADMTALPFEDASMDAVACVLGIFFVEDMAAALAELWRVVKVGGRLSVAVLGPRVFQPMAGPFREAVAHERPDLHTPLPWERTNDVDLVTNLFGRAGIVGVTVDYELRRFPLTPEAWWRIALGSGFRRWLVEIGPASSEAVRLHNAAWIESSDASALEIDAIYALATKQGDER